MRRRGSGTRRVDERKIDEKLARTVTAFASQIGNKRTCAATTRVAVLAINPRMLETTKMV